MLPPILKGIKEQLVRKDDERSQSESDLLFELNHVEKYLDDAKLNQRVIKPLKRETIIEASRHG